MKILDIRKHKTIVVMGTGSVFLQYENFLNKAFRINYLTDNDPNAIFKLPEDKYTFISPDKLKKIDDPFVIVATSFTNYQMLDKQLNHLSIPHCFINAIEEIYESSDFPVVHLATLNGKYTDKQGNVIEIGENVKLPPDTYVQFGRPENIGHNSIKSRNNHLSIGYGTQLTTINGKSNIQFMGDNSTVKVGNNNVIGRICLHIGSKSNLSTGAHCSIESMRVTTEGGEVNIGDDCMFSHDIELWQTDTHPFFDIKTGARLNTNKNIIIGKHVWLGLNATLLGGANIGSGSIVGAKAVTSSAFPKNVVIAGNPARVLREKIEWRNDELALNPEISRISDCYTPLKNSSISSERSNPDTKLSSSTSAS